MNAKITYYETFSDDAELPGIEECAEFVSDDLGVDYNVALAELRRMDFDNVGKVDENMFAALYFDADEAQISLTIKAEWALCTSVCDRCSCLRLSRDFLCSKSRTLRAHCRNCRGDVPAATLPKNVFCRLDFDDLSGRRLALVHLMNMEAAASTGRGLDCCYVQRCIPAGNQGGTTTSAAFLLGEKDSREAMENRIREALFRVEGYRYTRSKTGTSSSRFICSQRSDSVRTCVPAESLRKRQKRESAKLENCGGVLVIKFGTGAAITLSCFHEYVHESVSKVSQISDELGERIRRGAEIGLSPFQILADVNREESGYFTWGQVYYRWNLAMESMYRTSANVFDSARAFLANSERFKEIYYVQEPFALGFLCNHAHTVCEQVTVKEAFIDSTFKTNSSRMELFAVLGSFLGSGFPVAYLLLQPVPRNDGIDATSNRKNRIQEFLRAVHQELTSFRPVFFFTDKDFGQIFAISSVYRVTPSICLWHMKRAVKRKLGELHKEGVDETTQEQRNRILDLLTEHFNSHPFFSSTPETIQSLHLKNLQEMSAYCARHKISNIYSYLLSSWYTWDRYVLWGRRHPTAISFTRTTMTIEAHWSLVKRHYLLHHNRPRVDFVLYILENRLIPKVEADYSLLIRGLKKPRWWRDFTKEWMQAKSRPIEGNYSTNAGTWTCSCPAYRRSRFCFCKHLIANMECPAYRELVRNRHPPFLQFRVDPDRHVPDMGGELHEIIERAGGSLAVALQNSDSLPNQEDQHNEREGDLHPILTLLHWLQRHVSSLIAQEGTQQLDHLERNVLKRLRTYQERVQNTLNSRSIPKTWENADTVFLP